MDQPPNIAEASRRRSFLPHLILWLSFVLLWTVHDLLYGSDFIINLGTNFVATFPFFLLIALNYYVFLPWLFERKKFIRYFLIIIAAFLLLTIVTSYLLYALPFLQTQPEKQVFPDFFISIKGRGILATGNAIFYSISMGLYFLQRWNERERYTRELENRNLQVELEALRQQLNPHLIFNVLNSVYFTIATKPEIARQLVMQFSDLLSYHLYESSKEVVPLEKEISHLRRYLELEQLRQQDNVVVQSEITISESGSLEIIPLILFTFVENAFKHGPQAEQSPYQVRLRIWVEKQRLHLFCQNDFNPQADSEKRGGIGLSNARRRLKLAYPGQHRLQIESGEQQFSVQLEINLNGHEMHHSG